MLRFRQMRTLQKFASIHVSVTNHFNQERHLVDRQTYRTRRGPRWPSGSRSPAETEDSWDISANRRLVAMRLTAPPNEISVRLQPNSPERGSMNMLNEPGITEINRTPVNVDRTSVLPRFHSSAALDAIASFSSSVVQRY